MTAKAVSIELEQELRTHISTHKHKGREKRKSDILSDISDTPPATNPHLLILPKGFPQLGTKCI